MPEITVKTPGKLIITGEHSVVYGCPALATPTEAVLTGVINPLNEKVIRFKTSIFVGEISLSELPSFYQKITTQYHAYLDQKLPLKKLQTTPDLLLFYTVATFSKAFSLNRGWQITLDSELPIGAGMGSSAAVIITILRLLLKANQMDTTHEKLMELAKHCENIQHGRSSGLDLAVAGSGKPILFQNAIISPLKRPGFSLYLVETGIPSSSTGECVQQVQAKFTSEIGKEFTQASLKIIQGFIKKNLSMLKEGIEENQQLLEALGVVPMHIIQFRKSLKKEYSASFKISGAGSIIGDAAGMGLIFSSQDPTPLCQKYGFKVKEIRI
jgi:mevalonate kinase